MAANNEDLSGVKFATSDREAKARARVYEAADPFPDVRPALLAASDIADYVRVTGMLFPFNEKGLKDASYEIFAGWRFIYWDKKDGKIEKQNLWIDRSKISFVTLPPNSISFIETETHFRLPRYIALRFNLQITHVHRGLLLGTGPLVDPGFHGKLLIPLHNLTATPYDLDLRKGLIWVEFTKTTFKAKDAAKGGFPESSRNLTADDYLRKANSGKAILSSIPGALDHALDLAKRAEASATLVKNIGIGAAVGAIVGAAALVMAVVGVVQDAVSMSMQSSTQQGILRADIDELRQRLDELERQGGKTAP